MSHLAVISEQLAVEALEKLSLDLMLQKLYGCVGNTTLSSDRVGSGFHKESTHVLKKASLTFETKNLQRLTGLAYAILLVHLEALQILMQSYFW